MKICDHRQNSGNQLRLIDKEEPIDALKSRPSKKPVHALEPKSPLERGGPLAVGSVLFEEHLTSIHLSEIERVSFAYESSVAELLCQVYLMWGRLVLPSKTDTLRHFMALLPQVRT